MASLLRLFHDPPGIGSSTTSWAECMPLNGDLLDEPQDQQRHRHVSKTCWLVHSQHVSHRGLEQIPRSRCGPAQFLRLEAVLDRFWPSEIQRHLNLARNTRLGPLILGPSPKGIEDLVLRRFFCFTHSQSSFSTPTPPFPFSRNPFTYKF